MILGATGSIGTTALSSLKKYSDIFEVVALSCHSNYEMMHSWATRFHVRHLCITDTSQTFNFPEGTLYSGEDGLKRMIETVACDVVLNGISGSAGLVPSFTALGAGKNLALANKESVVMGGHLLFAAAEKSGATIIPVDSEHSTINALIGAHGRDAIDSVIITASGGPFREFTYEQMKTVSVEDALSHPTWSMGRKISIDSATLANKGLEVIEASFLFQLPADYIEVTVHPQSVVHSMIRMKNGAVYAQLSPPDMALPIMDAINILDRPLHDVVSPLSFAPLDLNFSPWDPKRFPMLALAYASIESSGGYPIAFNGANEVAVDTFLNGKIPFLSISDIVHEVMQDNFSDAPQNLEEIITLDRQAKQRAHEAVQRRRG